MLETDRRNYVAHSILDFQSDIMALTGYPPLARSLADGTFSGILHGRRVVLLDNAAINTLKDQADSDRMWSKVCFAAAAIAFVVVMIFALSLPVMNPWVGGLVAGFLTLPFMIPLAVGMELRDDARDAKTLYLEQQALQIMAQVDTGRIQSLPWEVHGRTITTPALTLRDPEGKRTIAKVLLKQVSKTQIFPNAVDRFVAPYRPIPA